MPDIYKPVIAEPPAREVKFAGEWRDYCLKVVARSLEKRLLEKKDRSEKNESSRMRRPLGVTVIALATLLGAVLLAVGAFAFFLVAVMAVTGGDGGDPVSASIAGMGIAGGFSLLVLAGVTVCIAIGVLRLREWARVVSIVAIGAGILCTVFSVLTFAGHPVIPVVPLVFGHVILIAGAVWMLAYLARPNVKQAFRTATA